MKKSLRLIAALLAVCVLAAASPPVGIAAGEASDYFDLRAAVEAAQSGDTITLQKDAMVNVESGAPPWIISKNIAIEGNGHSVLVRAVGILLDADVTFQNMELSLEAADGRNAIIANGHHLTLDRVTAGDFSINVFCGSFQPASGDSFSVPAPGSAGRVTIKGSTKLQGSNNTLGPANIYAGSLSIGVIGENAGPDGDGPATTFSGDAAINIEGSAGHGSLGTIYAGGGQSRTAQGQTTGKVTSPDPDKYRVNGTVTITGTNALPDVDGAGSTRTNVVYRGDGNQASQSLQNISRLSVETGLLALKSGSGFRNESSLSVSSGAKLDLQQTNVETLNVHDFNGGNGGFVFLGKEQNWKITGQVTGTAKVAIGGTVYGDAGSQTLPTAGHTYITAPNSQDGNFALLPYGSSNMTLERNPDGEWKVPEKVEEAGKLVSLQPGDVHVSSGETDEVIIPLNPAYTTGQPLGLKTLPLQIRVNDTEADLIPDESGSYYQAGGLRLFVGKYDGGESLVVYREGTFDRPLDGVYQITITVPGAYTSSGSDITAACTMTVGGTPPDPSITPIPVPTANPDLKWTGAEQTGVSEGTGYTLSGHKGTDVGNYTATATLEPNYQWNDGTTTPKTIAWSIAKAGGPAAPAGLAGAAPSTAGGSNGKITGTTNEMEYASNAEFTGAQTCGEPATTGLPAGTYYVRMKGTDTREPGDYATITVPAPGAPVLQSISVNSTAHKTEYRVGDPLDVTGLTIEAVYSDGNRRTVPVTADMVSGFDSSSAAEGQILTIRYEGQTAAYPVNITAGQQPGEPVHQVTVSNTGSGGTAAGVYAYQEGADVTVRAGRKDGFTFLAWDAEGMTLAGRNSPDVRFKMPAGDVTLNAVWTPAASTPGHTHVWDPAWKYDAACHWHDCTASGCMITDNSQKSGYAAHTAGDWVVDRPATSTQSGIRHRSCTVCGFELDRESIPATGGGSFPAGTPLPAETLPPAGTPLPAVLPAAALLP